jgi:uncharacterized protein YjbI with pentapeptide repeats
MLHERFLRAAGGSRAFLQYTDAPGVDGRRRLLNDADFTGADLEGALFTGCHLERALLYCANLAGCDLRAANLKRADLRGAHLAGAALNGAVLDEADMRAAYIVHAGGDGVLQILRHGGGPSVGLGGAESFGADFTNCAMRGVRLCAANLKGANFSGAVLDGADFTGAKLTDAIFHDTVLTSMDVDYLELTAEQRLGCVLDPAPAAFAQTPALLARLQRATEWVESNGRRGAPAVVDREDLRPLGGAFRGRLLTATSARGACAIHMDFSGSELQGAIFDRADLRGAVFEGADIRGASFRGAKLSHARFGGADLAPLVLPSGELHPPNFDGASMERADFTNTILE